MKVTSLLVGLLLACFVTQILLAETKNRPKPQEVFGSYWTAEPGWHTEFQLRNNLLAAPLTVTPVLRLANGQEYPLSPVTISPSDVATVDVSRELSKIASPLMEQAGTYGSVVFRFTSPFARNLYAAVMVHEMGQQILYHVDAFPMDPDYTMGAREGIWWLPRSSVKDYLIIANGSDQPNQGRLFLYDAAGKAWQQNLTIGARQTVRLVVGDLVKRAGLSGAYGGLRFEVAQRAGSIDTVYFLYDETAGFSAIMKMFDHNPATKLEGRLFAGSQVWKTWAPMLPLQNPDPALALPPGTQLQPKIFLRNTTSRPQTTNVKLTFRGDSNKGVLTLPPIQLKPFETRLVDVHALQRNKQIPTDAHWALVEISSLGNPDDIMAIASSFDSTGRYGSQTPFADQLSDHWVAGKFEVDATHNSLIAVTNAGKKPTDAVLTFHYNQGQGQYEVRKTIAAGDQLWLNLGDILRGGLPDTKGRTFPPDLTWGTYEIREPGHNNDPSLFEGKIIVDKTYGHLAYGCTTCCGDTVPLIVADPTYLETHASAGLYVIANNTCSGLDDDLTGQFSGWGTGNSSIATMNSNQITGVGVGSTNAFSSGTFNYNNGVSKYCTLRQHTAHNTSNVVSVNISGADLESNVVNVSLSGPSVVSGALTTTAAGTAYQEQISADGGAVVGPGPYQLSFNRPVMPLDTYYSLTADWGILSPAIPSPIFYLGRPWWVIGLVRHSQYNTPTETACNGLPQTAWLFNSACQFTPVPLKSDFVVQTEVNGTGSSLKYGILKFDDGSCKSHYPAGANSSNSLRPVSSITGACNTVLVAGDAVATNPSPNAGTLYHCADDILLVTSSNTNQAIKHSADYCTSCASGFNGTNGHIDDYSAAQACTAKGVGDYGNFWSANTKH